MKGSVNKYNIKNISYLSLMLEDFSSQKYTRSNHDFDLIVMRIWRREEIVIIHGSFGARLRQLQQKADLLYKSQRFCQVLLSHFLLLRFLLHHNIIFKSWVISPAKMLTRKKGRTLSRFSHKLSTISNFLPCSSTPLDRCSCMPKPFQIHLISTCNPATE